MTNSNTPTHRYLSIVCYVRDISQNIRDISQRYSEPVGLLELTCSKT